MGSQDADKARLRVVDEVLTAVKMACDACVRQEKEHRDRCISTIETTKVTDRCLINRPTDRRTDGRTQHAFFRSSKPSGCMCSLLFVFRSPSD